MALTCSSTRAKTRVIPFRSCPALSSAEPKYCSSRWVSQPAQSGCASTEAPSRELMKDAVGVDLAAGTAAGVAQLLVGHPFDTVKVRMQVGSANTTAIGAAQSIIASNGVLGFYRGMGAPLATVAAFNAVLFSAWGTMERVLSPNGAPLTPGQAVVAGAVAGVPVSLLATPTELLKCRLQAQGGRLPPAGTVYSLAEVHAGQALFRGPLDVLRHVVRYEGGIPFAAYRGLGATLLRELPGNAGYFGVYTALKSALAHWKGVPESQLGPGALMAAGGIGGAAFWVFVYPVDVIKSRLQTQNVFAPDRYQGVMDCARRLYRTQGWQALWRGFGPCMTRSVPANAAAFLAYEECKKALSS